MVASEYAKAIYELALEENKLEVFKECFDIVLTTLKDKDYYKVLTTPNIDITKKIRIIDNVYKNIDNTFINFIKVILEHNRINIFEEVASIYDKQLLENKNIIKIQVYSVVKLNNMELIHLTEALQQKYKDKKIELENIIDSKLIGGIHIVSNGESIDISLKNSLTKLKESL